MQAFGLPPAAPLPPAAAALEALELPPPSPTHPRDLVVRVLAVSLSPLDLSRLHAGASVSGYDAAGIVLSAADGAARLRPGDEVFYAADPARQGALAELHAVDESRCARKPEGLTFAEAASMPRAALAAWAALAAAGVAAEPAANAGKAVLVEMEGACAVGAVALQLAKRVLGLTVVAAAAGEAAAAFAASFGADHVVPSCDGVGGVDFTLRHLEAEGGGDGGGEEAHEVLCRVGGWLQRRELRPILTARRPWSVGALREALRAVEAGEVVGRLVLARGTPRDDEAAAPPRSVSAAVVEGFLTKRGSGFPYSWRRRLVRFDSESRLLEYFSYDLEKKGELTLTGSGVRAAENNPLGLIFEGTEREMLAVASTEEEREKWLKLAAVKFARGPAS
ncbi:hypothetical protein AB1Y20_001759 [Prymnesium parvum]|uniref:PH domain-containing protein n=1 Tax=Prymnesium parvum TaxID=97485 RepID=A0AB34K932_PRYPA